jgi:hypothetical protein
MTLFMVYVVAAPHTQQAIMLIYCVENIFEGDRNADHYSYQIVFST